jgi:hypothetical protein
MWDVSKVGQSDSTKKSDFVKLLHPWFSQEGFVAIKVLIALNCGILVVQSVLSSGESILSPSADLMIRWGADFGPATLNGE